MRKSKFIRRVRTVLFIFVVLMIFSILTSFQFGKRQVETYDIVVNDTDTIWNIAKDICNKNDNLNIQNIVIEIKDINNLSSSNIYVGQVLSLPIY